MRTSTLYQGLLGGALFALWSSCSNDPDGPAGPPADDRPAGASTFISADGATTTTDRNGQPGEGDEDAGTDDPGQRTVEEGDIYRLLGDNVVLNLNYYRGLQVIDFADVENPEIIGNLRVSGTPVEMYVVGDTALVLLNNWYGYYGSRFAPEVDYQLGGVVLSIDLSDPTDPQVVAQDAIAGNITTSRLTRSDEAQALYVVGSFWQWEGMPAGDDTVSTSTTHTVIQSYDVTSGALQRRSQLDLGGYVAAAQATPEALLVARYDETGTGGSLVSLIDISNPQGNMVEGDQIRTEGMVENQFNMDLYNGVLRVVSQGGWNQTRTNHLETFDASNYDELVRIDHDTFGDNEDLYATLFLGNKAFFVTFFRMDPFHAFEINDAGEANERSQFVVSGWNDFFEAVADETRLVGVGIDTTDGWALSISLYDITDLENTDPLLARADVGVDYAWSEANWDHRAFTVLEDAVSVAGPDGSTETGLILLPFYGWDDENREGVAAVQIFTFSDHTVTRRAEMNHGTPVRRSFLANEETTANLSDDEISFFDSTNPDEPQELSRLLLAPNYTDYLVFGDYAVRLLSTYDRYWSWWGSTTDLPAARAQVIPRSGNPDTVAPVAEIEVPPTASVYQAGNLLVSVDMQYRDGSTPPTYETTLVVYDLSDPTAPFEASRLTTEALRPYYGYSYYGPEVDMGAEDCFDCGGYYYGYWGASAGVYVVDQALVFLQPIDQQEVVGTARSCYYYPSQAYCYGEASPEADGGSSGSSDDLDAGIIEASDDCYVGSLYCYSLNDETPSCSGEIALCEGGYEDGFTNCEAVDANTAPLSESCSEWEQYRYWQQYSFRILDLSNPTAPTLDDAIALPAEAEGVSVLAQGSELYVTHRKPYDVEDDSRSYVRFYFTQIDLANPSAPVLAEPVNVPGQVIAVTENLVFTRDTVWDGNRVETAVARLQLSEGRAYLEARRAFPEQAVYEMLFDGYGHLLVSHTLDWQLAFERGLTAEPNHLSILDTASPTLAVLSNVEVDTWSTLRAVEENRAVFQVPGGLLLMNLDDPALPYPQAYWATLGWPHEILLDETECIFAAGKFGIYAFPADLFNLIGL